MTDEGPYDVVWHRTDLSGDGYERSTVSAEVDRDDIGETIAQQIGADPEVVRVDSVRGAA